MKATLAIPPYLPDQSAQSGALRVCNNTLARIDGYGPLGAFAGFSGALGASFKGGASFIAVDGTSNLLVGTTDGLLKYAGAAWTTLVSGMAVTQQWHFAQFGNYAIGVNGALTKVTDLNTGVTTTLAGAPTGQCIAIIGDYVVIGQTVGDLLGIFTSGAGNHTQWDVVTTTATYQPMLAGGEVMGLAGGEFGVILQRQRLVRMSRTGSADVPFAYDEISTGTGCASKGSVAQIGNRVFFLGDDGFKCCIAGQEPILNIGFEKIDRTFITAVPRDDWGLIYSAIDPQAKTVMWCVPGGKLWIYNWELDRWTTASPMLQGVFSGFTSSTDLETLAVTYPDLDAMTISLDDPRWSGGAPRLYAVSAGIVGTFTGASLTAEFEFSFAELAKGRYARISSVRPVGDAVTGLTLTLDARARLGDAANVRTSTDLRASGVLPLRTSGRYVKPDLMIAAGTVWGYMNALDFEYEAGGER